MLSSILSSDLVTALAWTLIHSVWQIGLVALLLALFLNLHPSKNARLRYGVALASMSVVSLMVLITFASQFVGGESEKILLAPVALEMNQVLPVSESIDSVLSFAEAYKLPLVKFWLLGAIFFLLRFIGGYLGLKRWVRLAETESLQSSKQFQKLRKKFKIHREVLVKSTKEISTPMVVGFVKPVILFPIGLINQLSTEEVSAILAHELAHISRHDYVLHLFQSLMEVFFYYHPCLLYTSPSPRDQRGSRMPSSA